MRNYKLGIFELETQPATQLVVKARLLTPLDGTPSTYEIDGRLQNFALNFTVRCDWRSPRSASAPRAARRWISAPKVWR